jgi:hypothetical protein
MRRKTFRLGCCALSFRSRRHVAEVNYHRADRAKHRDSFITSEEMLARLKSQAGIRKLEKSEATKIARTIVDEAQPQGEIIAILKRAERRLETIKALPLVGEIRDLIEKVGRNRSALGSASVTGHGCWKRSAQCQLPTKQYPRKRGYW